MRKSTATPPQLERLALTPARAAGPDQGRQGRSGALTSSPRPEPREKSAPRPRAPERPGPRPGVQIPGVTCRTYFAQAQPKDWDGMLENRVQRSAPRETRQDPPAAS